MRINDDVRFKKQESEERKIQRQKQNQKPKINEEICEDTHRFRSKRLLVLTTTYTSTNKFDTPFFYSLEESCYNSCKMLVRSFNILRPGSRLIRAPARRAVLPVFSKYDFRTFSSQPKGQESKAKEQPVKSVKSPEDLPVDFSDISRAKVAIRGGVRRTDCVKSYFLSELIGANIYLKPEVQQFTGSFKERGARNAILQLMREQGSSLKGVIAASAGNHALALAYHGKELGIPVTVVMPIVAPLAKVDKCRVCQTIVIKPPVGASAELTLLLLLISARNLVLVSLLKVPISEKRKPTRRPLPRMKISLTSTDMTILRSSQVREQLEWR
jgi:hypothetical protein